MTTRRSLAGLLLVILAAAGCGVGTRAETAKERSTPYRAGANAGDIAIRAVRIVLTGGASASAAPAASASPGIPTVQAYLSATLVNSGNTPDSLTSATIAGGAVQTASGGTPDVAIPPAQVVQLAMPDAGAPGSQVLGVGALASPLVVGTTATVTFTFASAGTVSLDVPVIAPEDLGTTASAAPVTAGG